MSHETHDRALGWASERLRAESVGGGGPFHLRGPDGRRIRVAGRHVAGREPNYFHVGPTLAGDPFDDLVVVLFERDWSVRYAHRLPIGAVRRHSPILSPLSGPRILTTRLRKAMPIMRKYSSPAWTSTALPPSGPSRASSESAIAAKRAWRTPASRSASLRG